MILSKVLLTCTAVYCSFIVPLYVNLPTLENFRASVQSRITYSLGKKVLTGDVNLYFIYYGVSWTASQKQLVEEFANGLGASSWYKKVYVDGALRVAKTISTSGPDLSGTAIGDLIQKYVDNKTLPEDENGIYFVLSTPDVKETIRSDLGEASFCSDYCGYHISSLLESGKRVQYGFVGNPSTQCPKSCIPPENRSNSPNKDVGIDALLSTLAHEITEAITDPLSDVTLERAWKDSQDSENADKCAYEYGETSTDHASKSVYNLEFGGRKYLIQQNWSPVSQSCIM